MSLAATRSLRSSFPQARLSVLARPWVAELYSACPAVDEILLYDREGIHRGPRGFFRAARELREKRFEVAVLLLNAFRAAALAFAAGIPERWGYATDGRGSLLTRPVPPAPRPFGRHQVFYYLDLLRALGIPGESPDLSLSLTETMKARARALLEREGCCGSESLVGLHPGATNGPAKRWLSERYTALGERLAQSVGARIVLLAGPAEKDLAREVAAGLTAPVFLAGETQLGELMGVLGKLSLFVSNDSGPMHLAAALGVPTLGIFGPTDERETGPWGRRARVVRERVDCSPCLLRVCPIDHRCMTRLEVEQVYQAAVQLLEACGRTDRSRPEEPRVTARP
jgi:heptosyltransferase-2